MGKDKPNIINYKERERPGLLRDEADVLYDQISVLEQKLENIKP